MPSLSTFSRAFAEFARFNIAERLQESFLKKYHQQRLIGHIARDATAIPAREKAARKPKNVTPQAKKRPGRPKKTTAMAVETAAVTRLQRQVTMTLPAMLADLPTVCDIGVKKNAKGFKESWKGYKFPIDTADGDIPISAILTSASVHDSQVALPLARLTASRVTSCYALMDAAYDAETIREEEAKAGRVALIDFNRRNPKDQRRMEDFEAERYKKRSAAERVNSQLKDNYAVSNFHYRGAEKVSAHLMFGLVCLAIEQSIRLLT